MSGKNKPVKAYKKKNSPVIGGVFTEIFRNLTS